ncbi:MAG TPA: hypothetical protein PKU77_09220 [Ferruginibacter sp.]|nr:hypothetical protein [Ferruginibacter sp.]
MFGLFKSKEKKVSITDLIWMTDAAKKAGLIELLQQKPNAVVCGWFADTVNDMKVFLQQKLPHKRILLTRDLHGSITNGNEIIFIEHYPLYTKEQTIFQSINATEITVISSFDDPLFSIIGSANLPDMMRRMGVQESESLSHKLISNSIAKAQQKLEKEINYIVPTDSAKEWYRINKPAV